MMAETVPYGDNENFIVSDDDRPCCVCGRPTRFVEINYQARFCSKVCIDSFEKEIFEIMHKREINGEPVEWED